MINQFPPLIAQTQQMLAKTGINMTLKQVYQELLKDNFINPDGTPTKWAIENGYVYEKVTYPNGIEPSKVDEEDTSGNATSDADINAVFSKMPPSAFHYINDEQGYYIEAEPLRDAIKQAMIHHELSPIGAKRWQKVLEDLERQL